MNNRLFKLGSEYYSFDEGNGTWKTHQVINNSRRSEVYEDKLDKIKFNKAKILTFKNSLISYDLDGQCFRPLEFTDYMKKKSDIPFVYPDSISNEELFSTYKLFGENKTIIQLFKEILGQTKIRYVYVFDVTATVLLKMFLKFFENNYIEYEWDKEIKLKSDARFYALFGFIQLTSTEVSPKLIDQLVYSNKTIIVYITSSVLEVAGANVIRANENLEYDESKMQRFLIKLLGA